MFSPGWSFQPTHVFHPTDGFTRLVFSPDWCFHPTGVSPDWCFTRLVFSLDWGFQPNLQSPGQILRRNPCSLWPKFYLPLLLLALGHTRLLVRYHTNMRLRPDPVLGAGRWTGLLPLPLEVMNLEKNDYISFSRPA